MGEEEARSTGSDPDTPLVRRAREGDTAAFEELVSKYEDKIYHLALRYSNDSHEAFDLAQETFLRVYTSLKSFAGRSRFSTWLYRVAVNVCLDELRRKRRQPILSVDEPIITEEGTIEREIESPDAGPDERLDQVETRSVIEAEIASLPVEFRQAVILRDGMGMSYEEIGRILNVSLGTVKSRIHRGRAALRERFKELELLPSVIVEGEEAQGNPPAALPGRSRGRGGSATGGTRSRAEGEAEG